jgi:hypothetical protein
MKTAKAVVVINLIRNQCFYIIDEKYHDYKIMSMFRLIIKIYNIIYNEL